MVGLRCSAPDVASAAEFTRWLFGRSKFTVLPASPLIGARAAIEIVLGAPLLSVELTASPSGELIRDYLLARKGGIRTHLHAQSILRIPPMGAPMHKGRRFRAARTNSTRARREGITCRELPESERPRVLRELNHPDILRELNHPELLGSTLGRWWVAETTDRSAAGVALATVDQKWALLHFLIAPQYPARYLLHTHMVLSLQASGVRYLAQRNPNALLLSPGLRYLQARLGYEVFNLRVTSERLARSPATDD
jgi:hypothetical protein